MVVITDVTAPIPAHGETFYEDVDTGGFVHHSVTNPPDGFAQGTGSLEVSQQWDLCGATGFINNIPDPVFTSPLSFSPNPVTVGQTVTANWATQNATSGCTYNGSPINTQGPLVFTAGMEHSTTHTILCAAAGQPSASSTANLNVLQCSPNSPGFIPPASSSPPSIQHLPIISGVWGVTDINYNDTLLSCPQTCTSNQTKYRLTGNITVLPTSFIRVSTDLPAVGNCTTTARTAANVTHTDNHELVHANALVAVINTHKLLLGAEFNSAAQCEAEKVALRFALSTSFSNETANQANHNSHAGERRHAAVCATNGQPTSEIVCGIGGWNCTPYGNFYPGP